MTTLKFGDQFKVLRTHYPSNPYYHIKLITGSNTHNPNGTGAIPLEVGQVLTFDRSNFWDCSFWSINGVTGKIECTPETLLQDGVIARIN